MTTFLSNPVERTRFIRFSIVGILGAVVDFAVMNILVNLFAFPLIPASTISFIAAVISNFTWNRLWTYPDARSKPLRRQLLEFSVVSVIGLGIRVAALAILEPTMYRIVGEMAEILGIPFELPTKIISDNLSLAITILIVLFWNFFANRFWTYSDVDNANQELQEQHKSVESKEKIS